MCLMPDETNPNDPIPPRPTPAELGILHVLWRRGYATVREVHEELDQDPPTAYTTTLKLLQVMTAKGLVERDKRRRSHIYRPCLTKEETQQQILSVVVARAFEGSASMLVQQLLAAHEASDEELSQIRELLEELEGGSREEH